MLHLSVGGSVLVHCMAGAHRSNSFFCKHRHFFSLFLVSTHALHFPDDVFTPRAGIAAVIALAFLKDKTLGEAMVEVAIAHKLVCPYLGILMQIQSYHLLALKVHRESEIVCVKYRYYFRRKERDLPFLQWETFLNCSSGPRIFCQG